MLAAYGFTRTRGKLSAIVFCICDLNDDAISGYTGAKLSGLKLDEASGYELEYMASGYFSPFSVYLITKYMRRIPVPLIEAAKIDGANEFQVFTKICIPICKGVITTCAILVFMDYWNMVEQPLLFLTIQINTRCRSFCQRSMRRKWDWHLQWRLLHDPKPFDFLIR